MKKDRLLIFANICIYIFFTYRVKIEHDFQARIPRKLFCRWIGSLLRHGASILSLSVSLNSYHKFVHPLFYPFFFILNLSLTFFFDYSWESFYPSHDAKKKKFFRFFLILLTRLFVRSLLIDREWIGFLNLLLNNYRKVFSQPFISINSKYFYIRG